LINEGQVTKGVNVNFGKLTKLMGLYSLVLLKKEFIQITDTPSGAEMP